MWWGRGGLLLEKGANLFCHCLGEVFTRLCLSSSCRSLRSSSEVQLQGTHQCSITSSQHYQSVSQLNKPVRQLTDKTQQAVRPAVQSNVKEFNLLQQRPFLDDQVFNIHSLKDLTAHIQLHR